MLRMLLKMLLMMTLLTFLGLACSQKPIIKYEQIWPPLPDEIILPSLEKDKNDRTGKVGWNIDDVDMKKVGKAAAQIKTLHEEKTKYESNKNSK